MRSCNGSWRIETCIKIKGRWAYLHQAVDRYSQTIEFLLSARRAAPAAKRFFRKALGQPHTVNPRTTSVDKNAAYSKAVAEMKGVGKLWRRTRLRQCKYPINTVEQGRRPIGCLVGPGLRFGRFSTA